MKLVVAVVLAGCAYFVWAERCRVSTDCSPTITMCAATTVHSHISCDDGHCTCDEIPRPCLDTRDCANGTCTDKDGHRRHFHCLDSYCTCIEVPGEH